MNAYSSCKALIIGVGRYADPQYDLSYARSDAEAMAELLGNEFGFDQVWTLYDSDATRQNLIRFFEQDLQRTDEDDGILIFFAGHGITVTSAIGDDRGFLVPHDGDPKQPYANLSLAALRDDYLPMIPAKHVFLIVDSCYGGLALRDVATVERPKTIDDAVLAELTRRDRKVRQVLAAGGKDQRVLDGGLFGHSVFTGRLIEALREANPYITADHIGVHVRERVARDSVDRKHSQTPQFGYLSGSQGTFVFRRRVHVAAMTCIPTVPRSDSPAEANEYHGKPPSVIPAMAVRGRRRRPYRWVVLAFSLLLLAVAAVIFTRFATPTAKTPPPVPAVPSATPGTVNASAAHDARELPDSQPALTAEELADRAALFDHLHRANTTGAVAIMQRHKSNPAFVGAMQSKLEDMGFRRGWNSDVLFTWQPGTPSYVTVAGRVTRNDAVVGDFRRLWLDECDQYVTTGSDALYLLFPKDADQRIPLVGERIRVWGYVRRSRHVRRDAEGGVHFYTGEMAPVVLWTYDINGTLCDFVAGARATLAALQATDGPVASERLSGWFGPAADEILSRLPAQEDRNLEVVAEAVKGGDRGTVLRICANYPNHAAFRAHLDHVRQDGGYIAVLPDELQPVSTQWNGKLVSVAIRKGLGARLDIPYVEVKPVEQSAAALRTDETEYVTFWGIAKPGGIQEVHYWAFGIGQTLAERAKVVNDLKARLMKGITTIEEYRQAYDLLGPWRGDPEAREEIEGAREAALKGLQRDGTYLVVAGKQVELFCDLLVNKGINMDIIMNGDPRQINYAGEDLYAAYCETVDYGYAGVVWFKDRDVGIERVGHRLRIWGKWVAAPPGANLLEHSEYEVLPVEKWEPLR